MAKTCQILFFTVCLLGGHLGAVRADDRERWWEVEVPIARDLAADAVLARRANVPILLVFSQDHCPFCKTLKREIIRPMILSGEYLDRVIFRELFIDEGEMVQDFWGGLLEAAEVGKRYNIWVTPTLLFLDPDGKELTKRILGVNTLEMYGYYVDKALDEALTNLRGGAGRQP